jgi:flagellar biogenesis protein FliO
MNEILTAVIIAIILFLGTIVKKFIRYRVDVRKAEKSIILLTDKGVVYGSKNQVKKPKYF